MCRAWRQGREKRGEGDRGEARAGGEWREAARIEQVCKGEIRVLQVSLQDWYIDLRESKTKRCGESFITGSRVVNIISNAALSLYYEAIIPNTCQRKKRKSAPYPENFSHILYWM